MNLSNSIMFTGTIHIHRFLFLAVYFIYVYECFLLVLLSFNLLLLFLKKNYDKRDEY